MKKHQYAVAYDKGKVRKYNEDRILCCPENHFFAVSDGMGGLSCGEETAEMICNAMEVVAKDIWEDYQRTKDIVGTRKQLEQSLEDLGNYIYDNGNANIRHQYGATFCGVMILDQYAVWINVGDSRGYQIRRKKITQITKDHNMAALLKEEGINVLDFMSKDSTDSQLYRYIGMEDVTVDTFITRINKGDRILLCTDGLYKMQPDKKLFEVIKNTRGTKRTVERMKKNALANGGMDNISIIYIRIK